VTLLQNHPAVSGVYDDPVVGANGEVGAAAVAQGAGGDGAGGDGAGGDGAGGDGAGGDQVVFVTPVPRPAAEIYPWGVDRIGASDVHDEYRLSGEGVKVAVLDTGIDRSHPDLAANLVGGFNAIAGADPANFDDDNGHGTAMAGIIAARRNHAGVIGAAPRALIYAVKVLDRNGQGHTSDGIHALGVLAEREDIRLINMSYGTALVWPLFQLAIRRSYELGKIIVTSRGNGCTSSSAATAQGAGGDGAGGDGAGGDGAGGDGAGGDGGCTPYAVKYPAAYPEVIAVGATTARDEVAGYSLWGGVDMVAPGGDSEHGIITTNRGGGYGVIVGTSPAAAYVSGAVALTLESRRRISFERLVAIMQRTADHLACRRWPTVTRGCQIDQQGAGLIDVKAMIDSLERD
jgi:subtilisin family serine protease